MNETRPIAVPVAPAAPRGGGALPVLFAMPLGVGAALLFCVQPMIAKMVLPQLGGTPGVWNTCMVFFQAALLAGYAYAHVATARLGMRGQAVLHAALLAVPLCFLPIRIASDAARTLPPEANPAPWLLGLLLTTIGIPFFVVSTTAPLLQRWFAQTGHPSASDPYFLYAASNLGSMLALLGYPLVIEPNLPLGEQAKLWARGYVVLVALILICAATVRRLAPEGPLRSRVVDQGADTDRPRISDWASWIGLAFVPSSMMLGVTTFITTDIASIPLLWVIPLAIYLLTFILVFTRRPPFPHEGIVRVFPTAAVCLVVVLGLGATQVSWVLLHLLTFFLAAMVCHGELARRRPPARDLTAFYLAMSIGGVLGGAFNALIAPVIFHRIVEYPLALVLACLARPAVHAKARGARDRVMDVVLPIGIGVLTALSVAGAQLGRAPEAGEVGVRLIYGLVAVACFALSDRPVRFALAIGAVLAVSGYSAGPAGPVEFEGRSFYGVLKVVHTRSGGHEFRRLIHGVTLHGQQNLDPTRLDEPLTYFTRTGPFGQIAAVYRARPASPSVGIVGLGAGSMACYAQPDQRWTFYEIDPTVVRIARDPRYFTFLRDSRAAEQRIILGDARLRLRDAPDNGYGLIVMDAFSSDAVPVHLISREALQLYRRKLTRGGLIALNITNQYIDFAPVLAALARDEQMVCRIRTDLAISVPEQRDGKFPSRWAVMAEREADLGTLRSDPNWTTPEARPGERAWSDDFSNVVEHLIFWKR